MKLSISNIAWDITQDEIMYEYLHKIGFDGIEIAPTRLVADNPYNNIALSVEKVKYIKEKYNLSISSMQSIWFGRTERIFGTKEERCSLINYTKKAVDYAAAIDCKNLVFGSPKNRIIDNPSMMDIAIEFFYKLGENAKANGVVIALEPNPEIYNTNFINKTNEAIQFVKKVNSKGLQVNMDLGTIIWNNEKINDIVDDIDLIHHIHISEPYLVPIEQRELHKQLSHLLNNKYDRFVSVEMKKLDDLNTVKSTVNYVNEVMR